MIKMDLVLNACIPSTQEVEAAGSGVWVILSHTVEFEATWTTKDPVSKKKKKPRTQMNTYKRKEKKERKEKGVAIRWSKNADA